MDLVLSIGLIINTIVNIILITSLRDDIDILLFRVDDLKEQNCELKEKIEELECEIYNKF